MLSYRGAILTINGDLLGADYVREIGDMSDYVFTLRTILRYERMLTKLFELKANLLSILVGNRTSIELR
jgi:hypothetical protein